ncbi:unnamed protein product, partial [Didymodactylos carnosus]
MSLPCLHLLFYMKHIDQFKVDDTLIAPRWLQHSTVSNISFDPIQQMNSTTRTNKSDADDGTWSDNQSDFDNDEKSSMTQCETGIVLTVADKNRLSWNQFHVINNYLTQLGTPEFYERLNELKKFHSLLSKKQRSSPKANFADAVPKTLFTIQRTVHPRGLTTPSHQSPVSATFNGIISLQRKKLKSDQDETTEPESIKTANNNITKNNDNQLNMSPTNQPSVQPDSVEKIDLTEEHQTNSVILIEKSGN